MTYPDWSATERAALLSQADRATHVYLSHDHEDHFDPDTLRQLSPKVILTGDFANATYRANLEAVAAEAGHRVRYVGHGERVDLGPGVTAQLFLEQPSFRTNSIMVLSGPDGSVLNGNDCGLDSAVLAAIAAEVAPTVFLYTLNFLANGYPYPYLRATDVDLGARITAVRDEVVQLFRTAWEILRPNLAIAFAGPVTFADAANRYLDDWPEARDWRAMVAELRAAGVVVDWPPPGSLLRCTADSARWVTLADWPQGDDIPRPTYQPPSDRFLAPVEDQPGAAQVLAAAKACASELQQLLAAAPVGPQWSTSLVLSAAASVEGIETEPPRYHIVCRLGGGGPAAELLEGGAPLPVPRLEVIAPPVSLAGLCDGSLDYDGFLLSGRARFVRVPDSFDSVLHNLLRFGRDPLARAALIDWWARPDVTGPQTLEKTDTTDGRTYTVPRVCPHEGESLSNVAICGGQITCPRHRWVYDVVSGQCLRGDKTVNLYGPSAAPTPR